MRLPVDRRVRSPNQDERPAGTEVSLLIVHSISLPPGKYGGDSVERLFTNRLDPGAHPFFRGIHKLRVSSHYLIRRDGEVGQFVAPGRRAWHAGLSRGRARARCNVFSIGGERGGLGGPRSPPRQYARLASLIRRLVKKLPLRSIAAHSDVAPGRKGDPGARF